MKGFRQRVVSVRLVRFVVLVKSRFNECGSGRTSIFQSFNNYVRGGLTVSARTAISGQRLEQVIQETRVNKQFLRELYDLPDPSSASPALESEQCHPDFVHNVSK
jgi:hypothetical protein